jgi:hypothetical protein
VTVEGALEEGANEMDGGAVGDLVGATVGDNVVGAIVGYVELEQTLPSLFVKSLNKGQADVGI